MSNDAVSSKPLTNVDLEYSYNRGADKLSPERIRTALTGRYSLCTPEKIEAIQQSIILGLNYKDAAHANDVDPQTLYVWLTRGKNQIEIWRNKEDYEIPENERMFVLLTIAVQDAIAKRKANWLAKLQELDTKSWQRFAWLLERLHTDEFGKSLKLEINDWRRDAVELVKQGLQFEQAVESFGEQEAVKLFEAAGRKVDAEIIDAEFSDAESESDND